MVENLERRSDILWDVQRSVRYHARRQAFFDRWRRVTSAVGVIFGSAAAVDLLNVGGHVVATVAAFIVAVVSAFDLVVGTGEMARRHDDLRRRFIALEAKIEALDEPTREQVAELCVERLTIEMDEPPTYRALDILCWNEQAIATDRAHLVRSVGGWQRFTAQWWYWDDLASRLGQTSH